jgi:hypothetical protein
MARVDQLASPDREANERERIEAEKALDMLQDLISETFAQHPDLVGGKRPSSDDHALLFKDSDGGTLVFLEKYGWHSALYKPAEGNAQHFGRFYSGRDYCLMLQEEGVGIRRATRNDVRTLRKFTKENEPVEYEQGSAPAYPCILDPR